MAVICRWRGGKIRGGRKGRGGKEWPRREMDGRGRTDEGDGGEGFPSGREGRGGLKGKERKK